MLHLVNIHIDYLMGYVHVKKMAAPAKNIIRGSAAGVFAYHEKQAR